MGKRKTKKKKPADTRPCWKCAAFGAYCYTCGEPESVCACDDEERNLGVCEVCCPEAKP